MALDLYEVVIWIERLYTQGLLTHEMFSFGIYVLFLLACNSPGEQNVLSI